MVSGLGNLEMRPLEADRDSGILESFDEVEDSKCKEWARANVETTRKYLAGKWKVCPEDREI